MSSREQVVAWAREQAEQLQADIHFEPSDGMHGGYWNTKDRRLESTLMARAASALEFLRYHAGEESEWTRRAQSVYESKGDNTSLATGVHALGEIMRLWADQVDRGLVRLPADLSEGVRAIASVDIMEQVRALNEDGRAHPAGPIVLAGAALETGLRAAVEQLNVEVGERPSISAYSRALRAAAVLSKQDTKDVEQMAGLRNAAAHGNFEELSRERAGLMEQQVNLFLSRLRDVMDESVEPQDVDRELYEPDDRSR